MSKGLIFLAGTVAGAVGVGALYVKACELVLDKDGINYKMHNRDTGNEEEWLCYFGKDNKCNFGIVLRSKKESENETESAENAESDEPDSESE